MRAGYLGRWLSALLLAACAAGCANDDELLYRVEIDVSLEDALGEGRSSGEIRVLQSVRGEGALSFPRFELDRGWTDDGALSFDLLYPLDEGSGLSVYAWFDLDGDGLLCAPGAAPEPAGLVEVDGFPVHRVAVTVTPDTDCVGPEVWGFPAE